MSSTRSLPTILDETTEADFRSRRHEEEDKYEEEEDDEILSEFSYQTDTFAHEFGPEHVIPIHDGIASRATDESSGGGLIRSLLQKTISMRPSLASFKEGVVRNEGNEDDNKNNNENVSNKNNSTKHLKSLFGSTKGGVLREITDADPETGEVKNHEIILEPVETCLRPQQPKARRAKELLHRFGFLDHDEILDIPEDQADNIENYKQYRLTTHRKTNLQLCSRVHFEEPQLNSYYTFISSSEFISHYLNWSFRTSFWLLVLQMLFTFWLFVTVFAGLILLVSYKVPECMQVGSLESDQVEYHLFNDAFQLSWTTFSTVGYGIVFPQISTNDNNPKCWGVNILVALEAFIGILFVATCSAIIYGKVSRVQAYANVLFSDTMVVKYGRGARGHDQDGRGNPFPVLEFRILNLMSGKNGGEIVSSRCSATASIKESKASKSLKYAVGLLKKDPSVMQLVNTTTIPNQTTKKTGPWKPQPKPKTKSPRLAAKKIKGSTVEAMFRTGRNSNYVSNNLDSIPGHRLDGFDSVGDDDRDIAKEAVALAKNGHTLIDEGSPLVPRRILSPLVLTSDLHPFFRSVWIIRHVINQNSPLLAGHAKKMIAENRGKWPSELNCPAQLRKALHFHQLIVSFTGTSQATRSRVYKQKLYEFDDLAIGYTFVETMYEEKSGRIHVDPSMINGMREQKGGGGEPHENLKHKGKNVYVSSFDGAVALGLNKGQIIAEESDDDDDDDAPPPNVLEISQPPVAQSPVDAEPTSVAPYDDEDETTRKEQDATNTEQGGKKDR